MREPITELPDDDAPFEEWCRPISATMINKRAATTGGNAVPGENGAGKGRNYGTTLKKIRANMRARGLIK